MKTYYLDIYLKNGERFEIYIDSDYSNNLAFLYYLTEQSKAKNLVGNIRSNSHFISIKKEEIASVEIVAEEVHNA